MPEQSNNIMDQETEHQAQKPGEGAAAPDAAGDLLDRAFGGMGLRNQ